MSSQMSTAHSVVDNVVIGHVSEGYYHVMLLLYRDLILYRGLTASF